MGRTQGTVALIVVLLLGLSACGGDSAGEPTVT
jgi:hypothetical protein